MCRRCSDLLRPRGSSLLPCRSDLLRAGGSELLCPFRLRDLCAGRSELLRPLGPLLRSRSPELRLPDRLRKRMP
jgi:hypothetical protein